MIGSNTTDKRTTDQSISSARRRWSWRWDAGVGGVSRGRRRRLSQRGAGAGIVGQVLTWLIYLTRIDRSIHRLIREVRAHGEMESIESMAGRGPPVGGKGPTPWGLEFGLIDAPSIPSLTSMNPPFRRNPTQLQAWDPARPGEFDRPRGGARAAGFDEHCTYARALLETAPDRDRFAACPFTTPPRPRSIQNDMHTDSNQNQSLTLTSPAMIDAFVGEFVPSESLGRSVGVVRGSKQRPHGCCSSPRRPPRARPWRHDGGGGAGMRGTMLLSMGMWGWAAGLGGQGRSGWVGGEERRAEASGNAYS